MQIQSISQLSSFTFEDFYKLSSDSVSTYIELAYEDKKNETGYSSYKFPLNKFFNYLVNYIENVKNDIYTNVSAKCNDLSDWNMEKIDELSNTINGRLENYVFVDDTDITPESPQQINTSKIFAAPITFNTTIDVQGAAHVGGELEVEGAFELEGTALLNNGANIKGSDVYIDKNLTVNGNTTIDSNLYVENSIDAIDILATNIKATELIQSQKKICTAYLSAATTPAELTARYAWWG